MLPRSPFDTNVARHIVQKTQLWAMRLTEFNYTIEYIPGQSSTWADLLTRWAQVSSESLPARCISKLFGPLTSEHMPELPSVEIIAVSQDKQLLASDSEISVTTFDGIKPLVNSSGRMYIPLHDKELQLCIWVVALCGLVGHRGRAATKSLIFEKSALADS